MSLNELISEYIFLFNLCLNFFEHRLLVWPKIYQAFYFMVTVNVKRLIHHINFFETTTEIL